MVVIECTALVRFVTGSEGLSNTITIVLLFRSSRLQDYVLL